ncbi:hypothetical protein Taro_005157 [Colocasia esculenta]|uniref:Uncharacterized protein n=1 Tax=Colocasia esculenta TaxID=4460 RepID=A0A843TP83_COLES|nr:hypothetical protein [Colocasia esculenta]
MAHEPPPTYTEREINHPIYCKYHAILLHPTDRCPIIRDWIESLIQKGKIDPEGNFMVLMRAREAAQREFEQSSAEEAQQQPPRRKKGSRRHQVAPPQEQTTGGTSSEQHFKDIFLKEEPVSVYNEESPVRRGHSRPTSMQSSGTEAQPESSQPLRWQNEDRRGKKLVMKPAAPEPSPYWAEFQELPLEIIDQAIDSTFQHQQDEAGWTTVAPRMRFPLTFPKRGGSHSCSSRESTSRPAVQVKELSPLEMAQAKKQEKNRQKNLKRRLKKQAEQAAAMMAPLELTLLQKLQKLIDELEEYIPSEPTRGVPLDRYIPWEEMERKMRLKSWLHQMLQRAQEGEKLPLPEELAIFYKEDEITVEKLEEMLKDFSCNMVSILPPASLQSPADRTPVGRGRGKKSTLPPGEKSSSPGLDKIIIFRGEKPQPIPEVEVRVNSFVFDPSDEEEDEQEEITSELPGRGAAEPTNQPAPPRSGQDETPCHAPIFSSGINTGGRERYKQTLNRGIERMTDQIKYRTAYTMDRYFKSRIISKEIGHIHRYHIKSNLSYQTKAQFFTTLAYLFVLCQAPEVHTPSVNKYVGVLLPKTGPGPFFCTGIGSNGPKSQIVPIKHIHIMATEFQ